VKRRVFNAIAAAPFLAAAVFWCVSQFRPRGFSLVDPGPGTIKYIWTTSFIQREKWYDVSVAPWDGKVDLWVFLAGRRAVVHSATTVGNSYKIQLRYCRYYVLFTNRLLVITSIGLLPGALSGLRELRRQNLNVEGTCKQCGYDLRATPERCPECGVAPEGK